MPYFLSRRLRRLIEVRKVAQRHIHGSFQNSVTQSGLYQKAFLLKLLKEGRRLCVCVDPYALDMALDIMNSAE